MRWTVGVVVLALLVALGAAIELEPVSEVSGARGTETGYGVKLVTDGAVYAPGEPIRMQLILFNHTESAVTLHFNSAQRFDFLIEDGDGREVFRWSDGKFFAQVLGSETIGPSRRQLHYEADSTDALPSPGEYTVRGLIVAREGPLSAELPILVR